MMSFKKNISASFAGNVVYSLSQWLLIIVFAKLGGEQVLGVYALALAVVSPVFALTNMNLRAVQATDAEKSVDFDCYSRFRYLSSVIAILICSGIAAFFYNDKPDICFAIIFLAFYKYFESKSDLVHGFFQRQERMDLIARSVMVRGAGNVLVMGAAYFFTQNLTISIAISIAKSWGVYYFIDYKNYLCIYNIQDFVQQTVPQIFQIAWPLGIVVFANTLNLNITRYFIAHYYGESLVGIFVSISYFIVAGATLVNAIGQSAVPRLAKLSITNMIAFKSLSQKIFLMITLVGMIGVLIAQYYGEWILRFVYTDTIADNYLLFVKIMWAGVAVYSSTAIGCILTSLRDFKSQSLIAVFNVIMMFISSLYLIQFFGMSGAVGAIALTYCLKIIVLFFRTNSIIKKQILYNFKTHK